MPRRAPVRAGLVLAALLVAACSKDAAPEGDAPAVDAGPTGDAALAPCLDRPGELARPPSGGLPCELLPPGFGR